jgi:hypothetical protein
MSRHLALDPREPPVSMTMPRQGLSPAESSDDTSDDSGAGGLDPGTATASRRARRSDGQQSEQVLSPLRPAARHHSGIERRGSRRAAAKAARANDPLELAPRGMKLSKAMLALLGLAVAAAAAGTWAYHSWQGNRALTHHPVAAATQPVLLDAVADTSRLSFAAGQTAAVQVQVSNSNQGTVNVSNVMPKAVTLSQPVPQGCTPDLVKVLPPSVDSLAVPPGGAVFSANITMDSAAPPDCEGIAFAISFVVQGRFAQP